MRSKLNAGIWFSKADPIASERLANGVGGGFVLLLLFKTSALALLSHHNCIAQRWKSSVAGLPSSNEIEVKSGNRIDLILYSPTPTSCVYLIGTWRLSWPRLMTLVVGPVQARDLAAKMNFYNFLQQLTTYLKRLITGLPSFNSFLHSGLSRKSSTYHKYAPPLSKVASSYFSAAAV